MILAKTKHKKAGRLRAPGGGRKPRYAVAAEEALCLRLTPDQARALDVLYRNWYDGLFEDERRGKTRQDYLIHLITRAHTDALIV